MRVLIVNDLATDTGGAERVSLTLRENLRDRGFTARLLASSASPVEGVSVQADDTCVGTTGPARPILATANPFAAARLSRVVRSFRPDIVHLRMFMWQLSPLVLRALRGVPTLLHTVNYDLICPMNTKTLPTGEPCRHRAGSVCVREGCMGLGGHARGVVQRAMLSAWLDRACDRLITNSYWVRERLEAEGLRVDDVVWNGVAPVNPRPPLAEASTPTVAFAGRLVPKKGVDTLIRAMAFVRHDVPDAELIIAGEGEQRAELERLAGELGIGRAVRFLGHLSRDDVDRAFAGAWVQAAPSRWEEPFGLVGAEAMMRGTAAVVTNTGGLSEQVIEGETGYHVPPNEPEAWAGALRSILGDRSRAETMGAAARRRALAEFTFERFTDRIIEQYEAVLGSARPAGHSGGDAA
jgi:glycosyltransferase involved in cell wall biosynthesis